MIYLDHNATTPLNPEAKQVMLELADMPLNPSSIHSYGRKGRSAIENARMQVADLVGVKSRTRDYAITFTSSGTEANNLVLNNYGDGEIFISNIEHSSVSKSSRIFDNVQRIEVNSNCVIKLEDLRAKLSNSVAKKKLVSIMLANNETGVVQPIKEITSLAREYGADMHSDCIQGPGKIPIDLVDLDLDFASISGHKFGGPTGVGALIAKAKFHLKPMLLGGGQEKSLRSGTENVLAIAAMGKAAEIAKKELATRIYKMQEIRDYLENNLLDKFPQLHIVARNVDRLPNTTLILNPGKMAETQVIAFDLKGVAISAGAACSSGKIGESDVLKSMGFGDAETKSALRVSVSSNTSKEEIDKFLEIFAELNT